MVPTPDVDLNASVEVVLVPPITNGSVMEVVNVGAVSNTATPVPVLSVNAVSKLAEEKDPRSVALPVEVMCPVRLAFVVTVSANVARATCRLLTFVVEVTTNGAVPSAKVLVN